MNEENSLYVMSNLPFSFYLHKRYTSLATSVTRTKGSAMVFQSPLYEDTQSPMKGGTLQGFSRKRDRVLTVNFA